MQVLIAFLLLFSLWTISSAADVTVYYGWEYAWSKPGHEPKPLAVSQFPWKYSYTEYDWLFIYLKNIPPGVTINVTAVTENGTFMAKYDKIMFGSRRGEEYYTVYLKSSSKSTEIKINLYKKSSNLLCASLLVAEGKHAATIPNEMKAQYYVREFSIYYELVVDLKHQCEDPPSLTGTTMSTTTEKTVTTAETNPNNNTITSNNNSSTDLEITTNKNSTIDTNPPSVTGTTMSTTTENTVRDSDQESTANEDSQLSAPDCQSDTSITENRPTSGCSTKTSKCPNIKRPGGLVEDGSSAWSLLMKYIIKEKDENKEEDDIDNFFYGIAATVKKFNEYNKAMIKSEIFNIVSQMELREIHDKGNNYYGSNNYSTAGRSGYSTTMNARQLNTPVLSDTEKDLTDF